MNDRSRGAKKNKITYIATAEGIERAEQSLIRLGFGSKTNFVKAILISRSTVTKFFSRKPIQLDSFQRICDQLTLPWKEIADLPAEETLASATTNRESRVLGKDEDMESSSTVTRQVFIIDKKNNITKAVITLQGDLDSVENRNILAFILKEYGGDTIVIEDIQEGSIKIFISGSAEDIERLKSHIESGEVKEINGFPVESIEIIDKWHLVKEIVKHPVKGRSLGNVDLSDADLSDADLSDADLSDADLSDADLSDADLSSADLRGADLSSADLRGADLRGAYLILADLRKTKIGERTKLDSKWHKVWEIINQGAKDQDLSSADLSSAYLRSADLSSADLRGAYLNSTDLRGADLRSANLSGANLSGANLRNADLRGANLSGANLSGANLSYASLSYASLSDTNLSDASLRGANLSDANLIAADLSDAELRDANLSDANLSDANLIAADLIAAKLNDANLRGAFLRNANLRDANLFSATLDNADLRDANLFSATLDNADLRNANLSGANLMGVKVTNARFTSNSDILESTKISLETKGAIFEDTLGDQSDVFNRV